MIFIVFLYVKLKTKIFFQNAVTCLLGKLAIKFIETTSLIAFLNFYTFLTSLKFWFNFLNLVLTFLLSLYCVNKEIIIIFSLSHNSETKLRLHYRRSVRNSPDPYKR